MSSRLLLRQPTISTALSQRAAAIRPLSTTSLLRLKESNKEASPEDYEKHKQDSIAKQKQGKGHWKAELASNSEESIKADRQASEAGGGGSSEASIKKMQDETKGRAEETRKHGTSMKDM
ncbi:hypothetical protein QBC39DRAFT_331314 [Podospora conica]|nr:hypothetical protein QBC39DRAFT_331314 [Schizothecium conicum]